MPSFIGTPSTRSVPCACTSKIFSMVAVGQQLGAAGGDAAWLIARLDVGDGPGVAVTVGRGDLGPAPRLGPCQLGAEAAGCVEGLGPTTLSGSGRRA